MKFSPAETKLLICVWHPFSLWRPPADVAVHVRRRFPEMRVVHQIGRASCRERV